MQDTDDVPLYRFKENVGYVLAQVAVVGIAAIEVGTAHFVIAGVGMHPNNFEPVHMGQIASGPWDGTFFFFEPGWYEKISDWADLV